MLIGPRLNLHVHSRVRCKTMIPNVEAKSPEKVKQVDEEPNLISQQRNAKTSGFRYRSIRKRWQRDGASTLGQIRG